MKKSLYFTITIIVIASPLLSTSTFSAGGTSITQWVQNTNSTTIQNPVHQYANTNWDNIEWQTTGNNTYQWTIQNGLNDPIPFTATENWSRTEFVVAWKNVTCDSWLCVWPGSDSFQAILDNMNSSSAANKNATTSDKSNILWVSKENLRAGNVDMNTIPQVIVSIIQTLLGIAGTVAIFSLIYHAVQMQINSGITGDSSGVDKAKKGMTGALIGFVIAIAAWFLVTRAVDLLSAVS